MDPDRPSWVAFFDILGFRELVLKQDARNTGRVLAAVADTAGKLGVDSVTFSDSVLLYTAGDDVPRLESIIHASVKLVGHFAREGIPLRGGIAQGEFFCDKRVFVGKAMVRAYELAESQDWMGAILDPSVSLPGYESQKLEKEGLLVEYEVPIKGGPVGPLQCLGWPRNYASVRSPIATTQVTQWDILRKDANTRNFLRWYKSQPGWKHLSPVE